MEKTNLNRSLPASSEPPRVMQDMRTGDEASCRAEPTRNDGIGPNLIRSFRPEKSRRYSSRQRLKRKKRGKTLNCGTWNVRTLLEEGKFELLINEISHYDFNIIGVSETRWSGKGHFEHDGNYVVFSGQRKVETQAWPSF